MIRFIAGAGALSAVALADAGQPLAFLTVLALSVTLLRYDTSARERMEREQEWLNHLQDLADDRRFGSRGWRRFQSGEATYIPDE